jgi:hypothetical protein
VARLAAVLDANVLYPARLRDLFLRLAIAGLFRAHWTERILDECFTNLSDDRPDIPAESLLRTRRLMGIAVPDAVITDYDHLIDRLDLPDRDDRHLLAAAIAAEASLVTFNLADFPRSAVPPDVSVLAPDDFVLSLIQSDLDAVATVVDQQAAALRNPPMTMAELLEGLAAVGLAKSVAALRSPAL